MPQVTFSPGVNIAAIHAEALTKPVGQQKLFYSQQVVAALGTTVIFEIRVGSIIVYRAQATPLLAGSNGVALPPQMTEPPLIINAPANLSGTGCRVFLINATNSSIFASVPIRTNGDPNEYLVIDKDLVANDIVRLLDVFFRPPADLDVGGNPDPGPNPVDPDWLTVALTDMRRDPATLGSNPSYLDTYARNDATLLHRTESSPSSQATRAQLTMGRYPNPNAFDRTVNQDYDLELTYLNPPGLSHPSAQIQSWNRIIWWGEIFLSQDFGGTTTKHASGYTGNSRVMFWDVQVWVKRTSGVWQRIYKINPTGGEAWRPNFREQGFGSNYDVRIETNLEDRRSWRTAPPTGFDSVGRYWVPHPFGQLVSWDTSNVAEVLTSCRTSLILHNPNGTDDRDLSRYLVGAGGDYYGPSSTGGTGDVGSANYMYGIGTSRHKYVRAKYPDYQFHVMHTASWNSLNSSHPNIFS